MPYMDIGEIFSMVNRRQYSLACIYTPLLLIQLIIFFLGEFNEIDLEALIYLGWVIWVMSLVLGFLPIWTLKRRGGVPKGRGYVHTTVLVETGVYSIVRHPQYTAGILLSVALVLITQSWIVLVLGFVVMPLIYLDTVRTDRDEVHKFGEPYQRYMERVPSTNFLLGYIRLVGRRMK